MSDLEAIKAKLRHLDGFERLAGGREIRALPEILHEGETFLTAVQGKYSGKMGLLAATDRRLAFVNVGLVWGRDVQEFPLASISSLEFKTGLVFGSISIVASNSKAEISEIAKARVKPFLDEVHPYIGAKPASVPRGDIASALAQLAELRAAGALDDAEFAAAKARLLG